MNTGNRLVQRADAAVRDRRHDSERGAAAVEYAIMASLIAVVVVVAVGAVGLATLGLFQSVINNWP